MSLLSDLRNFTYSSNYGTQNYNSQYSTNTLYGSTNSNNYSNLLNFNNSYNTNVFSSQTSYGSGSSCNSQMMTFMMMIMMLKALFNNSQTVVDDTEVTVEPKDTKTIDVTQKRFNSLYSGLQKAWNGQRSHLHDNSNITKPTGDGWWSDINLDGKYTNADIDMAFDLGLDTNGDGKLHEAEVGKAITKQADKNSDSKMTKEEYLDWLEEANDATVELT